MIDLCGQNGVCLHAQMHLRVSKALRHDFEYDAGLHSAGIDWAEDITAFSGDSKVNSTLKIMNYVFKMMICALKMMIFRGLEGRYLAGGGEKEVQSGYFLNSSIDWVEEPLYEI